jgi:DnaJ homolog subfamily C member 19
MVAGIVVLLAIGGGGYYLLRIAPRVLARAGASANTATRSGRAPPLYQQYVHGFQVQMTEREALLILGFGEQAATQLFQSPSRDDIRERFRLVMAQLHSDVDGSPYIATKVNEARDMLMRK